MEAILAHIQDYAATYGIIAACVLPVLYMTRRYSAPALMWGIELVIYSAIMHVVIHYFVIFVRWFRINTVPHYQDFAPPEWMTPLGRFWDHTLYDPPWVFYAEFVALLLMIWAMVQFRPMKVQRMPQRRNEIAQRAKPGAYPRNKGDITRRHR